MRTWTWPAAGVGAGLAFAVGTRAPLADPVGQFAAVVLTVVGGAVLIALPGLAAVALLRQRTPVTRFGILVAGSGALAFADFWAWVASPDLGRAVALALLVASLMVIWWREPRILLDEPELYRPLVAGVLVALVFAGLAYSAGGLGGDRWANGTVAGNTVLAMSYRYWLAPDNIIPLLFAQHVMHHVPLSTPIFGGWQLSDRPPLQTAFTLTVFPLVGKQDVGYEFLSVVLQATWVPALWLLLRSRGFSTRRVVVVVAASALTGAVFVNTVYAWPKMLAATCCLAALAVLLEKGSLTLAAALATLAFLSHGGIAFSIIALLPFAWRMHPRLRVCGAAAVGVLALYLPWAAFQHFIDPPGNRLLKWELAGVVPIDHHSFLHDMVTQYAANPWQDVRNKLHNVEMLVGSPQLWHGAGFVGSARSAQVTSVVLATAPLLVGGIAWLRRSPHLRQARPLVAFVLMSLLAWVVIMFGNTPGETVLHQGSYAVVVLGAGLAALSTTFLPKPLAVAVLGVSSLWFVLAWVVEMVPEQPGIAPRPEWAMIALAIAAAGSATWLSWRHVRAPLLEQLVPPSGTPLGLRSRTSA